MKPSHVILHLHWSEFGVHQDFDPPSQALHPSQDQLSRCLTSVVTLGPMHRRESQTQTGLSALRLPAIWKFFIVLSLSSCFV